MISLADNVKIPGRKDETNDVLQLVQSWLNDPNKGKWVLVLDNVDDAEFLDARCCRSNKGKRHVDYLPTCSHGSMIVTSRNTEVARGLVDDDDTISLSSMTEEAALTLLKSRVGQVTNSELEDASELMTALEYMPLAIAQAGSFIKRRAPVFSIRKYLSDLKKSDKSKARLLSADIRELRRDREAKSSILSTWQISFEHILQFRSSAADMLSLMSFFDNQGIPDFLLQSAWRVSKTDHETTSDDASGGSPGGHLEFDSQSDSDFETDFDADVDLLRGYDLLSVSPNGGSYEMHRLVQLATQKWLESGGRYGALAAQAVRGLDVTLPYGNYGEWEICQVLYPHTKSVLETNLETRQARLDSASVALKTGWFMLQMSSADEAEHFMRTSFKIRKELLGRRKADTLESQNGLASALCKQGKHSLAEKVYKTLLTTQHKLFGRNPIYLIYSTNLAQTLRSQYKYDEAEKLYRDIMQAREDNFGQQDPLVVGSMAGLADVLSHQGKFEDAEKLLRRVLEWREKKLGRDDPKTLWSVAILGFSLMSQGKYDEAEGMMYHALELREMVLGKDHPDTLASLRGCSMLRRRQGRYEEAEGVAWRALVASDSRYGIGHVETVESLGVLAPPLRFQRKDEVAERICRLLYEGQRRLNGEDHPDTLIDAYNLAQVLKDLGRYQEALELVQSCVEISRRALGPDHKHARLKENLVLELEGKLRVNDASDSGWETDSGSD